MNTRPKNPANARNLNACIIGSSGSGKTRFWLTPQLLQAHSSYVCVDPKGGVLSQVGAFLQRQGYKVKVFNSIDFAKSMHYDEYSGIRWKGAKERFATSHADELEKYKKAQWLLHKLCLSHPIDRKSLCVEKTQLEQEVESLRPDVDAVQSELDELKTVRYWVRKVIPDALPSRTESGAPSIRNTMEESQNQNELNDLLERTAKQVIAPQQEELQSVNTQQHQATL